MAQPTQPYNPAYPDSFDDPSIKQWIEDFYTCVDTKGAVESIADFFTEDGSLDMGSQSANTREEIIALLQSTWNYIDSRRHHLRRIFPFGTELNTYAVQGTVVYGMKDGSSVTVGWSGVSELVKVDGVWKKKYYKVYLAVEPVY